MLFTHKVLLVFCYETVWLHHIDVLIKIVVHKCYFDIYLSYLIIEMHDNEQDYYDGFKHDYRKQSLLIVKTKFQTIILCYMPQAFYLPLYFTYKPTRTLQVLYLQVLLQDSKLKNGYCFEYHLNNNRKSNKEHLEGGRVV